MNHRIIDRFALLRDESRPALIAYITAGDPDLATTDHLLDALVDGGADVIELGMPFSDPMADGPVIQRAMDRALDAGTTVEGVLACAGRFRQRHPDHPMVLFGYANPIHRRGVSRFCEDAARAGVDGLLVVDLPPEESVPWVQAAKAQGLQWISLFTPTTDADRLAALGAVASGFAYCVSVTGVTGTTLGAVDPVAALVSAVRRSTGLPVAVGFGIRTERDAARMADHADGVVMGSVFIEAIEDRAAVEAPVRLREVTARYRAAIDGAEIIELAPQ